MIKTPILDKQKLIEIAKQSGVIYLALFGSYARGEADLDSDVDLYARFGRHISLFEMLNVKHTMEDALGLDIDLLVEEVVVPYQFVRDGITKDLVVLYEDVNKTYATTQ